MTLTCGLDVHKDSIFCATFNGKTHGEVKEYSTLTTSIHEMGKDLQSQKVERIAMESTSTYWVPVWNILEEMGFKLMLVNPFLIKQMPGRKSDVKDAQWIAKLLHKGMLRASLVPDKFIRELRTYSRNYMKLQQRLSSAHTEMERNLELCSIRVTNYVSNISSKSILKVINQIIQGETNPEVLIECIHGRVTKKHTKETIKESLTGNITNQHRFMLELYYQEFEMLTNQSEMCLAKMEELCNEHFRKQKELLLTIPGISDISAMIIIAETGADMKAFENSRKFSGWTGLRPRNDESAGKYKSTATTKGNKYLRSILVQISWCTTRAKGSYFKEKFNRLVIRKSRKKALIAIARKMGVLIWNVLFYEQPYNPEKQVVLDQDKLQARKRYYQRELGRLDQLI